MGDGNLPSPIIVILPLHICPVVSFEHLFNSRFGIKKHPPTDRRVRYLPRIAQGLERSGRNVQVVAHFVPRQVAFLADRRHVVFRRRFYDPFGLSDQREGSFYLVAVHCQIIQFHNLRFFRLRTGCGFRHTSGDGSVLCFRFQIGRHVFLPVKVFAAYPGKRNDSPFPVSLQRPFTDTQRKAHVLRVDSAAVRRRSVFAFQLPRQCGQRFQFSDEGGPYLLVDADCIHSKKF